MKCTFAVMALVLAGTALPASETLNDVVTDNGGSNLMNVCIDGSLFMPADSRYCTRDFKNGTSGKRLKIYPNKDFKDYDDKE